MLFLFCCFDVYADFCYLQSKTQVWRMTMTLKRRWGLLMKKGRGKKRVLRLRCSSISKKSLIIYQFHSTHGSFASLFPYPSFTLLTHSFPVVLFFFLISVSFFSMHEFVLGFFYFPFFFCYLMLFQWENEAADSMGGRRKRVTHQKTLSPKQGHQLDCRPLDFHLDGASFASAFRTSLSFNEVFLLLLFFVLFVG